MSKWPAAVFPAMALAARLAAAGEPAPPEKPGRPSGAGRVALGPGVVVDWERGVVEAAGSAAADLFAPSAEVARIKAERLARLRAEERLRKALTTLGRDDRQRVHLAPYGGSEGLARLDPGRASVLAVDYASSGSVSLRLSLSLSPTPAATPAGPAASGADAGTPAPARDGGAAAHDKEADKADKDRSP